MQKSTFKLTLFAAFILALLTVSPAHANLTIPIPIQEDLQIMGRTDLSGCTQNLRQTQGQVRFAFMDLSLLTQPIADPIEGTAASRKKPASESALTEKLNQLQALRYVMRSA